MLGLTSTIRASEYESVKARRVDARLGQEVRRTYAPSSAESGGLGGVHSGGVSVDVVQGRLAVLVLLLAPGEDREHLHSACPHKSIDKQDETAAFTSLGCPLHVEYPEYGL